MSYYPIEAPPLLWGERGQSKRQVQGQKMAKMWGKNIILIEAASVSTWGSEENENRLYRRSLIYIFSKILCLSRSDG